MLTMLAQHRMDHHMCRYGSSADSVLIGGRDGSPGPRTWSRIVAYESLTAQEMIRRFKAVATLISAATEDRYG